MSMGWDYVSELSMDLLFIPDVIHEYGELQWNDIDMGSQTDSKKNLFKYHFVHHKSNMK
jgi:hypothetical protein